VTVAADSKLRVERTTVDFMQEAEQRADEAWRRVALVSWSEVNAGVAADE
jgi:hypothetical protein